MDKWEYLHFRYSEPVTTIEPYINKELKLYGSLGWELVSFIENKDIHPITKNLCYFYSCVFKRKIQ